MNLSIILANANFSANWPITFDEVRQIHAISANFTLGSNGPYQQLPQEADLDKTYLEKVLQKYKLKLPTL